MSSDQSMEDVSTLSREGQYIVDSWEQFQRDLAKDKNQETLDISQVFGFVAWFYEKIRATVENKDEHVIRRFAIERALNRIDIRDKPTEVRALRLVKELTWSGFLPNRSITRDKLLTVVSILRKYDSLQAYVYSVLDDKVKRKETKLWLQSVASTELEEVLAPSFLRLHLVPTMYVWLKSRLDWKNSVLKEEELETQLFVAAHRALAKSDVGILRYHLLTLLYPQWREASKELVETVAHELLSTIDHIESLINFEYKNQIFRVVQKNTPPFIFIDSVLQQYPNPREIFSSAERLFNATEEIAKEKYAKISQDLRKGTIRSILYIFATKVVIALAIEYPYERYYLNHVNWTSIIINLVSAPVLMFLMAMTVRTPGDDNTERILSKLRNIVYDPGKNFRKVETRLMLTKKHKLSNVFTIIYAYIFVMLVLVLGNFLMNTLHFNIVSMTLFFMFVSLVLLFGFRLRWQAQELLMAKPQQGIFDHLISIVSIPFINFGVWLSSSLSKINFITFVLDKLVDAPLKASVNSAEEWTEFLKERHDEAVEVPGA